MLQNIKRSEPKKTIQSKIPKNISKFKNIHLNCQTVKDDEHNNLINVATNDIIIKENNSISERGQENDNNKSKLLIKNKNDESENEINENLFHTGRWTEEEHQKFIDGILKYGNEWKKVQQIIKTRSSTQARSHAQKFFLKIKKNIQSNNIDFNDKEKIIKILTINNNTNILNDGEKEKLLNVIFSNIKHEEYNNENFTEKICLEEDNLGYKKEKENNNDSLERNNINVNLISNHSEQKNLGLKRKFSKNFDIDKIFSIKKDMSHRASMDFSFSKISNIDENRKNSFYNLKNSSNQENKNIENSNLNNLNNNSQNNFDNCEDKKVKNNYIIHNFINITNNYTNNNYTYNIHNPETFNNIINNSTNYIQDSLNYSNDQSQNYYVNSQCYNKYNYNLNLDRNISNINGISKFNNFNDYDNINNNDPFKLEFGFYPDKINNNDNEHLYTINGEEEFIKTNNNEDNPSFT